MWYICLITQYPANTNSDILPCPLPSPHSQKGWDRTLLLKERGKMEDRGHANSGKSSQSWLRKQEDRDPRLFQPQFLCGWQSGHQLFVLEILAIHIIQNYYIIYYNWILFSLNQNPHLARTKMDLDCVVGLLEPSGGKLQDCLVTWLTFQRCI